MGQIMTDKLSFKVRLKKLTNSKHEKKQKSWKGKEKIRRFELDKEETIDLATLQQKIYQLFPDLSKKNHFLSWTDEDGDTVTISNDEDLIIALTEIAGPIYKIDANVSGSKKREIDIQEKHSNTEDVKCAEERGRPKIRTPGKHGKSTKNQAEKKRCYIVESNPETTLGEILGKNIMSNQIDFSGQNYVKEIKMKVKIKVKNKVARKSSKNSRSRSSSSSSS